MPRPRNMRPNIVSESTEDSRFPGRGRTLGSGQGQSDSALNSDPNLQARLLDDSSPNHHLDSSVRSTPQQLSEGRQVGNVAIAAAGVPQHQGAIASEEEVKKLVSMGFDRTQVEVALAAADGDLNVAVEILMSQQG